MTVTLDRDLETALNEAARRLGTTPEILVIQALRERFPPTRPPILARDDWERGLLEIAVDCGVSLSNEAVSSEGLYD